MALEEDTMLRIKLEKDLLDLKEDKDFFERSVFHQVVVNNAIDKNREELYKILDDFNKH